jgi:hypothetical protein
LDVAPFSSTAAHAAFVSIESMPHSYYAPSASQVIDDEISRCGLAQNHITRELEKPQPKNSGEQEVMRATLLTNARARTSQKCCPCWR